MLIGLTGCKGSGKDTVGEDLVDVYGFTRIAFADKLKEAVANLFGCSMTEVEQFKGMLNDEIPYAEVILQHGMTAQWNYTWREFLQHFGTEMGRNTFGFDFWVDQWQQTFNELPGDTRKVVATDVRFENEAQRIISLGGHIVEVTRPGHEPDGHASEEPLDPNLLTAQIVNDKTIVDLHEDVDNLMEKLNVR